MLKSVKNGLLTVIDEAGFSPSSFQLEEQDGDASLGISAIVALEVVGTPLVFYIAELEDFFTFKHCATIFGPNFPLSDWTGIGA